MRPNISERIHATIARVAIPTAAVLFLAGAPALGAVEEETRVLQLFYPDAELVVVATRSPMPLSRTAENITVVTAREIEELNPHSLAQLLSYVTGMMIDFQGELFTGPVTPHMQGSEERHILLLLDGIPWNDPVGGIADMTTIPVGIIRRIEIIKGPASSAWGSALGGVVNIITKAAGDDDRPTGSVSASGAGHGSWEGRAEAAGQAGPVGYYLYAGRIETDGLRDGRFFESSSFYGKAALPLGQDARLTFTAGASEPEYKYGDYPSNDLTSSGSSYSSFATAALDAPLTSELGLTASFYRLRAGLEQTNDVFGVGMLGEAGDLFIRSTMERDVWGGSARLAWNGANQTAVLGLDAGSYDTMIRADNGALLQGYGAPETSRAEPTLDSWAVYANDTIVLGDWSIAPGLRYDRFSKGGDFTSPSLGLTWGPGAETILRATVARGFTVPGLISTSVGGLFLDPNPSLQPEEVWSYQVGAETRVLSSLWIKATLFRHNQDKTLETAYGGGTTPGNDILVNGGHIHRTGVEVEAETAPWHGCSLRAGADYIHQANDTDQESFDVSGYNVLLRYDGGKALRALLAGRYLWWGPVDQGGNYSAFVWDLTLLHELFNAGGVVAQVGLAVHNLFNDSRYTVGDVQNARRWAEASLRLTF